MNKKTETSRRVILQTGLGLVAAAGVVASARAQDKLEQNLVQYQKTPKGDAQCSKCVNWIAPNACKIVAGTIEPTGWCVAFAPKDA
jgi:hypothetical protein